MIKYQSDIDIMDMLKKSGYTSYRIAQEKLFGQRTLTKFRRKTDLPSWNELDMLCYLCNCTPSDILEYIPIGNTDTE